MNKTWHAALVEVANHRIARDRALAGKLETAREQLNRAVGRSNGFGAVEPQNSSDTLLLQQEAVYRTRSAVSVVQRESKLQRIDEALQDIRERLADDMARIQVLSELQQRERLKTKRLVEQHEQYRTNPFQILSCRTRSVIKTL